MNYTKDVEKWCKRCEPCTKRKGPKNRTRAPLKQYISGAPMERLAIDILGPLPVSDSGNKYLLVIGDYFTKWTEAIPIPNQEAKTVADALVTQVITRFGVPESIHSDQGRNFESKLFAEVCRLLGIKKTRTTPYRPQSDGMVERFNRTIEDQLAKYVEEHQKDWDRHVPYLMMAYRTATHQSTGFSPAVVMFGREPRLPVDIIFGRPKDSPQMNETYDDYVAKLEDCLAEVHDFTRAKLRISSDRMKRRYDVDSTADTYHVGDAVRYCLPQRRKGITPKFQSNWDGPYLVRRKINDLIFEIQRSPRAKPRIVHKDRLCKFNREPPEWFKMMSDKTTGDKQTTGETTKDNCTGDKRSMGTHKPLQRPTSVPSLHTTGEEDCIVENCISNTIGTNPRVPGKRATKLPSWLKDFHVYTTSQLPRQ